MQNGREKKYRLRSERPQRSGAPQPRELRPPPSRSARLRAVPPRLTELSRPPRASRSNPRAPPPLRAQGERSSAAAPRRTSAPLLTALQGAAQRPALRLRADLPDHHQQRVPPRLPAARSARQPGRRRLHGDRSGRRLHGNATAAAAARCDWRAALKARRAPPRLAPLPRGAALLRRTEAWPEGRGSEAAPSARRAGRWGAQFSRGLLSLRRAQPARRSLGSGSLQARMLPHGRLPAGAERSLQLRTGPGRAPVPSSRQ